jgi:hypothetical protein
LPPTLVANNGPAGQDFKIVCVRASGIGSVLARRHPVRVLVPVPLSPSPRAPTLQPPLRSVGMPALSRAIYLNVFVAFDPNAKRSKGQSASDSMISHPGA